MSTFAWMILTLGFLLGTTFGVIVGGVVRNTRKRWVA